ncbi:hypothetical protein, partial [Nocardia cyriacigeorgica]|uniref:hypothetical protein n=1 Tax=Nocardia cyriacigeorgica TaxID=135487 RepID=UPI001C49A951
CSGHRKGRWVGDGLIRASLGVADECRMQPEPVLLRTAAQRFTREQIPLGTPRAAAHSRAKLPPGGLVVEAILSRVRR